MRTFRTELKMMYRDFLNWDTIETFAEYHAVAYEDMEKLIEIGKLYHDTDADFNVETRRSGMSLDDIKTAIYNGYTVYWKSNNYQVVPTLRGTGELLIKCLSNAYCVGLTRTDGTLVEDPKDFFLGLEN